MIELARLVRVPVLGLHLQEIAHNLEILKTTKEIQLITMTSLRSMGKLG